MAAGTGCIPALPAADLRGWGGSVGEKTHPKFLTKPGGRCQHRGPGGQTSRSRGRVPAGMHGRVLTAAASPGAWK